MAVPDYQSLMLPMLQFTTDGTDHALAELVEDLASHFKLSDVDRDQRLQSGQRVIYNRTHWAATYLTKAALLQRTGRGRVRITSRGTEVLARNLERLDVTVLGEFPEFESFRSRSTQDSHTIVVESPSRDPEELLDATYDALRRTVEADLLDHILSSSPAFFEQLVLDLLVAMGYGGAASSGSARHVGKSGDDGIDGVIDEDRLGLDAVYLQAKRWAPDRPVRRPDLQAFAGSMEGQRATKGVFITTSRFTDDARDYLSRISRRIVPIDGQTLTRLMYEHDVGVRAQRRYDVKRVDTSWFEGEV